MKSTVKNEVAAFAKVFISFGFKKLADTNSYGERQVCFMNEKNGWFADIIDRGNWADVWMVGTGLKTSGCPGGWIYGSPKEIKEVFS